MPIEYKDKLGLVTAVVGGFASIPMVFHLDTALWFNEYFVTTEVAAPEDLETVFECGTPSFSLSPRPPFPCIHFAPCPFCLFFSPRVCVLPCPVRPRQLDVELDGAGEQA